MPNHKWDRAKDDASRKYRRNNGMDCLRFIQPELQETVTRNVSSLLTESVSSWANETQEKQDASILMEKSPGNKTLEALNNTVMGVQWWNVTWDLFSKKCQGIGLWGLWGLEKGPPDQTAGTILVPLNKFQRRWYTQHSELTWLICWDR